MARKSLVLTVLAAASLSFYVSGCTNATKSESISERADAIFLNGRIYTVDADRSWAEAVAVRGDHFVRVGNNEDMEDLAGPETEIVDLQGKLVLPGLHDAHVHLISGYRQYYGGCRIPGSLQASGEATTITDIRAALADCADQNRNTEGWVLGGGFGVSTFPEGLSPRALLDDYFPDRPVFLLEEGSHAAWANSKALEIAEISKETEDPPFGTIWRDEATGVPEGILFDYSAMELVGQHIETPSLKSRMETAESAIQIFNSVGVTSFIEAGSTEADLAALRRLSLDGRLNARIMTKIIAVRSGMTDETVESAARIRALAEQYSAPRLNTFGAKLWLDGIFLNRTVAFDHLQSEHPWLYGNLIVSADKAAETVVALDGADLQTKLHALGDHSAHVGLSAIAAARAAHPHNDHLHHHLAHSTYLRPSDMPRFAELGASTDITAFWASPGLIRGAVAPWLGEEFALSNILPLQSMKNAGVRMVGGSDWPSSPANPFYSIQVGMTRQDPGAPSGEIMHPDERLSLEDMIDMYTIHGAWLMQQDELTGSIETGKVADFIILDRNLFETPPHQISETRVLSTLIDGRAVYHAEDSPLLQAAESLERAEWWW